MEIPTFFWKRIYTLNIDDTLERAYEKAPGNQAPDPITYRSPYIEATNVNSIQLVHIHGWANKAEDGYVFSLAEYASTMGPNSPWTAVLAHTIATEPFIVAGTSFEEPDIEYFLSGRQASFVRRDRGPSFLIEPNPDAGTIRECERHNLTLYKGTLLNFLNELETAFPARPLPVKATAGLLSKLFTVAPVRKDLALFSKHFKYVAAHQSTENADLGFFVGRPPTSDDISLGRDISRASTISLRTDIQSRFTKRNWDSNQGCSTLLTL